MTVGEIANKLGLKLLAGQDGLANTVSGAYICDLLSYVMSRASKGNVWITVQTNINIIAVAVLTEVGCIIIPENIKVEELTITRANSEAVVLFSSNKSAYELACELKDLDIS